MTKETSKNEKRGFYFLEKEKIEDDQMERLNQVCVQKDLVSGRYNFLQINGEEKLVMCDWENAALNLVPVIEFDSAQANKKQRVMVPRQSLVKESSSESDSLAEFVLGNEWIIEEGIRSLVSPISTEDFIKRFYQKKCFHAFGSSARLEELKKDFHDFSVTKMIQNASRIIVWMKTRKVGSREQEMQYIEAPSADIAESCYRAGHSLYFNPSVEVQEKYIRAICDDLSLSCGMMENGLPGDIEVFAVSGKHKTPWHFDSQDNFTIQVSGIKMWTIAPPSITAPLTNFHGASSNHAQIETDRATHTMYAPHSDLNSEMHTKDVRTVIMRPGSVLYIPSGWWHQVESLEEEGSLSLNMSIDGNRYGDLVLSRVSQLIYRSDIMRSRVNTAQRESTLKELDDVLQSIGTELKALDSRTLLPAFPSRQYDLVYVDRCDIDAVHEIELMDTIRVNAFARVTNQESLENGVTIAYCVGSSRFNLPTSYSMKIVLSKSRFTENQEILLLQVEGELKTKERNMKSYTYLLKCMVYFGLYN